MDDDTNNDTDNEIGELNVQFTADTSEAVAEIEDLRAQIEDLITSLEEANAMLEELSLSEFDIRLAANWHRPEREKPHDGGETDE